MKAEKQNIEKIGRLKKRSDFLWAAQNGDKWVSSTVIVQKTENKENFDRFGITVTKKTDRRAVTRNRIKRRLRSAALENLSKRASKQKPHHDFVLIGRSDTFAAPYEKIVSDFAWCLKRLDAKEEKPPQK